MLPLQVVSAVAAAYLIANHAPLQQRLWLYPGVAFALAFIDSSIQGLCTESMVSSAASITAVLCDDTHLSCMIVAQVLESAHILHMQAGTSSMVHAV